MSAPQSHPGIPFRSIVPGRSATTDEWTASGIILRDGELGYDTTADEYRRGNGTDVFADLPPLGGASGSTVTVLGSDVLMTADFASIIEVPVDEGTYVFDLDGSYFTPASDYLDLTGGVWDVTETGVKIAISIGTADPAEVTKTYRDTDFNDYAHGNPSGDMAASEFAPFRFSGTFTTDADGGTLKIQGRASAPNKTTVFGASVLTVTKTA